MFDLVGCQAAMGLTAVSGSKAWRCVVYHESGLVAAEQPAVIVGRFNRSVVTLCGIAMGTEHR
jgi:hypothetical protein